LGITREAYNARRQTRTAAAHEHLTLYPLVSTTKTELPHLLMLDALNTGVLDC
jgi:hypothetical protein